MMALAWTLGHCISHPWRACSDLIFQWLLWVILLLLPSSRLKLDVADNHAIKFTNQTPIEKNLDEEGNILQMQHWLDKCLTTHKEGPSSDGQPSSVHPLPTRVIDVGTESHSVPKLFQPTSVMYEKYITLSYCWGRPQFLTTLSSNIQAHFEGLEESTLPQTFVDAIKITRLLGFRYIWIDALCIIQDSMEDKAVEIGAMESIYSNSTLTIAVVNATQVSEGFLHTKPRLTVNVPCRTSDGGVGTLQISPRENVDLWQESLYTRAWCLQENLLSPRLLLFTKFEVVWQCQTTPFRRPDTSHVEYLYDNPALRSSAFSRIPESISSSSSLPQDFRTSPSREAERYKAWLAIVQNYTKRNLTVLSDRLPAISGVAQKFQDAWGDEYCAGIWRRQFIASLTWRRKGIWEDPPETYWAPLEQYRAPSWSWASIEGPIEFDPRFELGDLRGLAPKLIECEIVPLRYQAPLGEVASGKAVLEASLIPAREVPVRGFAGQDAESFRIGRDLKLDNHEREKWPGPNRAHVFDEELKEFGCVMLLGDGRDGAGKMTRTTALVLMPVLGEVDVFRRAGYWHVSVKGASKLWVGAGKRRIVTLV